MKNGFLNIGVMLSVFATLTGCIVWVYTTIDKKIEPVEVKAQTALLKTTELTADVNTIKSDTKEIRSDIKLLLQRIK